MTAAESAKRRWRAIVHVAHSRAVGCDLGEDQVQLVAVAVMPGDGPDPALYQLVEDANVGAAHREQDQVREQIKARLKAELSLNQQGATDLYDVLDQLSVAGLERVHDAVEESGPEAGRQLLRDLDPGRELGELSDGALAEHLRAEVQGEAGTRLGALLGEAAGRLQQRAHKPASTDGDDRG